jgi:transcriptional regulator GlxA family with amidase domain
MRTDPINEIALKVGFRHMGRFAAYYRQVFRELPSGTIRSSSHSTIR